MGVGVAEPIENRRFLRVPTAEKLKNLKTDCVCATLKKPRIAGLSERPNGVSAVGSLSCTKIERANSHLVRQIAGGKFAQKRLNSGLIFGSVLPPTHSAKPHKSLHRRKHDGAFRPLQGVRVSRKRDAEGGRRLCR